MWKRCHSSIIFLSCSFHFKHPSRSIVHREAAGSTHMPLSRQRTKGPPPWLPPLIFAPESRWTAPSARHAAARTRAWSTPRAAGRGSGTPPGARLGVRCPPPLLPFRRSRRRALPPRSSGGSRRRCVCCQCRGKGFIGVTHPLSSTYPIPYKATSKHDSPLRIPIRRVQVQDGGHLAVVAHLPLCCAALQHGPGHVVPVWHIQGLEWWW